MNQRPILSLIIPVYNVEKYIQDCLNSIFSQNVDSNLYEVIIINDGSSDASMEVVNQFTNNSNLKIINQTNQGLSLARNKGMDVSSGEFIWFIDSDDWILPNSIKTIINSIKKNPEVDVFSSVLKVIQENTNISRLDFSPTIYKLSGKEYLQHNYNAGASTRFILRKTFLNENNLRFYPHILHEDGIFGYSMLYMAKTIIILKEPIYVYRQRNGSIMDSITVQSCFDLVKGHKILKGFMNNYVSKEDKQWFQLQIFAMLSCCFIFSPKIYNTPEFLQFYRTNKKYIQKEANIFFHSNWNIIRIFFLKISPFYYFKFRLMIKNIYRCQKTNGIKK